MAIETMRSVFSPAEAIEKTEKYLKNRIRNDQTCYYVHFKLLSIAFCKERENLIKEIAFCLTKTGLCLPDRFGESWAPKKLIALDVALADGNV